MDLTFWKMTMTTLGLSEGDLYLSTTSREAHRTSKEKSRNSNLHSLKRTNHKQFNKTPLNLENNSDNYHLFKFSLFIAPLNASDF